MSEHESELYGVAAEFGGPVGALAAAAALRERNFGLVDAYSPLPIPGMSAALGMRGPLMGFVAMAAAMVGAFGNFGMILYVTVWDYPFNIGGRPLISWPYYIIPSVAAGTLFGAVMVVLAMLFLDRLPRINHPVFNIDGIERASQDRIFVVVEARSEDFDPRVVEQYLAELPIQPRHIQRVPR